MFKETGVQSVSLSQTVVSTGESSTITATVMVKVRRSGWLRGTSCVFLSWWSSEFDGGEGLAVGGGGAC